MKLDDYKHIIWDWNGTLLDDVDVCLNVMNGMLSAYGLPRLTRERYRDIFTFPVRDYYETLGFDLADFEALSVVFIDGYEAQRLTCDLHRGAREVLDFYHARGIPQSILSAYSQPKLEEVIDHFALTDYFVRLVGLDNIYAAGKMENARAWVRELGLAGREVLLIGDTIHDYDVAQDIGADCLLLSHGHQSPLRLSECPVALRDHLYEITNLAVAAGVS